MAKATEIAGDIFGRLRGAAKSIVEGFGGIFRELAKEHGEVTVLMKRISATSDVDIRSEVFPVLRKELLSHAKAEEREFYPAMENLEECRLLVEQAKLDHKEIEAMIEELNAMNYADATWGEQFLRLERAVEAHVEMEENELFPKAKDSLAKDQLDEMERRYEMARKAELESYATVH
jgi:hemerythrin superfamily protein